MPRNPNTRHVEVRMGGSSDAEKKKNKYVQPSKTGHDDSTPGAGFLHSSAPLDSVGWRGDSPPEAGFLQSKRASLDPRPPWAGTFTGCTPRQSARHSASVATDLPFHWVIVRLLATPLVPPTADLLTARATAVATIHDFAAADPGTPRAGRSFARRLAFCSGQLQCDSLFRAAAVLS